MTTHLSVSDVFSASRNGTDSYTRHPLARRLIYSSGVAELCEAASSFWLLDVIGTEATPKLLAEFERGTTMGIVKMNVAHSKVVITMTTADDTPPIWTRRIPYTDFAQGTWTLYLSCDTTIEPGRMNTVLILPSEY
jgi:hypothetical protein